MIFKCLKFNIYSNNIIRPLLSDIPYIPISRIIINGLKTHSGTKKRWTALPSGKFKRRKAGKTHLNSKKRSTQLNRLGKAAYVDGKKLKSQIRHLKRLLPFG